MPQPEQIAAIEVKNADHDLSNPNARYRKAITVEQMLSSAMIASPLRLFGYGPSVIVKR